MLKHTLTPGWTLQISEPEFSWKDVGAWHVGQQPLWPVSLCSVSEGSVLPNELALPGPKEILVTMPPVCPPLNLCSSEELSAAMHVIFDCGTCHECHGTLARQGSRPAQEATPAPKMCLKTAYPVDNPAVPETVDTRHRTAPKLLLYMLRTAHTV
jgi:hypothetical protein